MKHITIRVKVTVHAYAENELRDDFITDLSQRFLMFEPGEINAICGVKDQTLEINIYKNSSVKEFENALNSLIWGEKWKKVSKDDFEFFYLFNGCRAVIDKPKASFLELLYKYIDPFKTNCIEVAYYFCADAGQVYEAENLRFYMHSKEKGKHNKPHVHVEDLNKGNECSIGILDGELLDGKIKKKDFKLAQKIIKDNQELFIDYWNKHTDGLNIDINHRLGFIKY